MNKASTSYASGYELTSAQQQCATDCIGIFHSYLRTLSTMPPRKVKVCEMEQESSDLIQDRDYFPWLKAIRTNDIGFVKEELRSASLDERRTLLNGRFGDIGDKDAFTSEDDCRCDRPLAAAIQYTSHDVMGAMLDYGADPLVELQDGNIVHLMIILTTKTLLSEDTMLETYRLLMSKLPESTRIQLMKADNCMGLRPLELAITMGCLKLFKAIFETPGPHLVAEIDCGLHVYQKFDITEYEKSDRGHVSPLYFLCLADSSTMGRKEFGDILSWAPIKAWRDTKTSAATIPFCCWVLIRLMYVISYYMLKNTQLSSSARDVFEAAPGPNSSDVGYENATSCTSMDYLSSTTYMKNVLIGYQMIHSAAIIIFDILETFQILVVDSSCFRPLLYRFGKRFLMPPYLLVRLMQHVTAWCVAGYLVVLILGVPARGNALVSASTMLINIGLFNSMLYCALVLPVTGYHTLVLIQMFMDLLYFFVFVILSSIPFAHFYLVFVNTNSLTGCMEDFSGFFRSVYTLMLVTMNMRDMREYDVLNGVSVLLEYNYHR